MSVFILLSMLYVCFCCSKREHDFDKFTSNFSRVDFPLIMNDSMTFENWDVDDLIDTNYVNQFELISKRVNKDYPFRSINDYKCTYIGRFESDAFIVLIYKTYTTEAGRGNPEVILSIFTKDGKKKDEIVALWNEAEDPLYNQKVTLVIADISSIEIKSITMNKGYLNGNLVPRKITERIFKYRIMKLGNISLVNDITNNLFEDSNPEILDDFPQN